MNEPRLIASKALLGAIEGLEEEKAAAETESEKEDIAIAIWIIRTLRADRI